MVYGLKDNYEYFLLRFNVSNKVLIPNSQPWTQGLVDLGNLCPNGRLQVDKCSPTWLPNVRVGRRRWWVKGSEVGG